MTLTEHFIRKPVISIALCIVVILLGVFAFNYLPKSQFPRFKEDTINISIDYPGAAPDLMQDFVTEPIESALLGLEGIDYIAASNTQGDSSITIKLKPGYNINNALAEVNSRVSSVRWRLPSDIHNPSVSKSLPVSPAIFLAMNSSTEPLTLTTAYAEHLVIPELQTLKGVGDIDIRGDEQYAMKLFLDPLLVAAYHFTPEEVIDAVKNQHLQAAIGTLRSQYEGFTLNLNSSLEQPYQFDNLVISNQANQLLKLNNVGYAKLGSQYHSTHVFTDGLPSVLLYVKPILGSNVIDMVHQLLEKLPSIANKLPPGMHLFTLWNPTKFSQESLHAVRKTLWEAILLIVIITCMFLGEIKAMFIPILTIPLSLLGAATIIMILGFSLNTMTLLAAVLAIGLVVDDAIVVLENIHRHISHGEHPLSASIKGIKEITPSIITMTLVVAIVFVPIALLTGPTGALFSEFAISLCVMVLLSGVFALTVSPMMCAHMLKAEKSRLAHFVNCSFDKVAHGYSQLLRLVFKNRYLLLIIMMLLFALCYALFYTTPSELLPDEDQGVVLATGTAPSFATVQYRQRAAAKLANIFKGVPEMQHYGIINGDSSPYNNLVAFLVTRDHKKGDHSEAQLIQALTPAVNNIPEMQLYLLNRPLLADVIGLTAPVSFVVQSSGDYKQLYRAVNKLLARIKQNPNIHNVTSDLHLDKPSYMIDVNRFKANAMGISMQQITSSLNALYAKPRVAWLSVGGFSYPVVPQVANQSHGQPIDLNEIELRSEDGQLVSLGDIAHYQETIGSLALDDFQGLHSATISATLDKQYTLGQALHYIQDAANQVLPHTMKYDYNGQSRLFIQSTGMMTYIFLGCIIIIYLLLVIKFNSFMDPLIIMMSVPLSICGALAALHLQGFTLNIYTEIGLVMLMGLISKHGIMIIDFANHLQAQQHTLGDAILQAAKIRLRPILMTTFAMVLGAIPLMLATGAGHESLQQIGTVVVAGLSVGSLMTLFVIPTLYLIFAKRVEHEEMA